MAASHSKFSTFFIGFNWVPLNFPLIVVYDAMRLERVDGFIADPVGSRYAIG